MHLVGNLFAFKPFIFFTCTIRIWILW